MKTAVALTLALVTTVTWSGPRLRAADQPGVYVVPQEPACDPDTREGSDALWSVLLHGTSSLDRHPRWMALTRAAADHPDRVTDVLAAARCYYTFYRGFSRRPHLDDVERLLAVAAAAIQRERETAAPMPDPPAVPGAPMRVGSGATPARTRDQTPIYPPDAARQHLTGVVFIDATIDASGLVREARVVGSIPLLDRAAQDSVRKWRFEPTVVDGKRVAVIKTVAVKFGGQEITPADAIDEAAFFYAQRHYLVAEAMLTQAVAAVRVERAAPVRPLTDFERLAETGVQVFKLSGQIHQPEILSQLNPRYTTAALKAKIEGDVEIEAVVLTTGVLGPLRVSKSLDATLGLDAEAVKAVRQWRFRPATRPDGTAVPVIVTLVLTYRMH